MKTPATKIFFILVLSVFGLSGLKCDSFNVAQSEPIVANSSNTEQIVLSSQVRENIAQEREEKENSSDFIFHFPNIFDVFRSLF